MTDERRRVMGIVAELESDVHELRALVEQDARDEHDGRLLDQLAANMEPQLRVMRDRARQLARMFIRERSVFTPAPSLLSPNNPRYSE